jgi:hypothetical protein
MCIRPEVFLGWNCISSTKGKIHQRIPIAHDEDGAVCFFSFLAKKFFNSFFYETLRHEKSPLTKRWNNETGSFFKIWLFFIISRSHTSYPSPSFPFFFLPRLTFQLHIGLPNYVIVDRGGLLGHGTPRLFSQKEKKENRGVGSFSQDTRRMEELNQLNTRVCRVARKPRSPSTMNAPRSRAHRDYKPAHRIRHAARKYFRDQGRRRRRTFFF